MTNLTNLLPEYSYADVLTTTNGGQGLDNVLRNLQDGLGNNSTLLIANNAIKFLYGGGNSLYLNNTALTSSGNNINLSTQDNPIFQGTGALTVPIGDTSQRPSIPVDGMIRYNSETANFEFRENGAWVGSAGVATITGTPNQIVVTGTTDVTLKLANDIDGIHSITTSNIGIDIEEVGAGTITTNSGIALILKPNGNNSVQIGKNITVMPSQPDVTNLEIRSGGALKIYDSSGTTYSGWKVTSGSANNVLTMPTLAGTAGQVLQSNGDNTTSWVNQSVNTVTFFTVQIGHGLVQGDVIKVDTADNKYKKAQADAEANAEVVGIVSDSTTNTFSFVVAGICIPGGASLTPGKAYFLSTSAAGGFTTVDPLNPPVGSPVPGQISKPLFIAIDSIRGAWVNQRGIKIK